MKLLINKLSDGSVQSIAIDGEYRCEVDCLLIRNVDEVTKEFGLNLVNLVNEREDVVESNEYAYMSVEYVCNMIELNKYMVLNATKNEGIYIKIKCDDRYKYALCHITLIDYLLRSGYEIEYITEEEYKENKHEEFTLNNGMK